MTFEQKRWRYMGAAMVLAFCSGIGFAWSVFQKPLMENFGWTLKTISITFTLQVLISTLSPVFLSRFQEKWGVKTYLRVGIAVYIIGMIATMFTSSIGFLYIFYGFIVGIGIAILYPALMAYATSLFPDKTGMASGLLASLYGSGAVFWAPIATVFINRFDILSVFGILAAIFAIIMIPMSFIITNVPADFKPKAKKDQMQDKNISSRKEYTWKEMLKTSTFYVLLLALTLGSIAGLMITGHASSMIQEILSYTPEQAAVVVGLFSVFNALGRLVCGLISDKFGRYNVMLLLFAIIVGAMFILSKSGGIVFIMAILFTSACSGGFSSMFSPICADLFGMKNLAVNYAFMYTAFGFAGLIGPQLAARIRTASGGYNGAFLIVAGMSIVGLILVFYIKAKVKAKAKAKAENPIVF